MTAVRRTPGLAAITAVVLLTATRPGAAAPAAKSRKYTVVARATMRLPPPHRTRAAAVAVAAHKRVRRYQARLYVVRDHGYGRAIPPRQWATISSSTGRPVARIRFTATYDRAKRAFRYRVKLENLAVRRESAKRASASFAIFAHFTA
jgi:hypothetical protein